MNSPGFRRDVSIDADVKQAGADTRTKVGDRVLVRVWKDGKRVTLHARVLEVKGSREAKEAGWFTNNSDVSQSKRTGVVLRMEVLETGAEMIKHRAHVKKDWDAQ